MWVEIGRDGELAPTTGEPLALAPGRGLLGADVVFPVLHGRFGEDGTVQGLLEMLDVAYVGAGVAASAVCIDKVLFKELMAASASPQVDYVGVREERARRRRRRGAVERCASSGCRCSSSRRISAPRSGIVKVTAREQLLGALEPAFAHDTLAIVEAVARGIEVECAVLGAPGARRGRRRSALASMPGEIRFDGDWYDFDGQVQPRRRWSCIVPAPHLRRGRRARAGARAWTAFARAGCEGLARVDFFVDGEQVLSTSSTRCPASRPRASTRS